MRIYQTLPVTLLLLKTEIAIVRLEYKCLLKLVLKKGRYS